MKEEARNHYWAIRPHGMETKHTRIERARDPLTACQMAFGRHRLSMFDYKDMGTRIEAVQSDKKRIALLTDPNNWTRYGASDNPEPEKRRDTTAFNASGDRVTFYHEWYRRDANNNDVIDITIYRQAFEVLACFASVSRTINTAIRLLDDLASLPPASRADELETCIEELRRIEPALHYVNQACQNKVGELRK